MWSLHSPHVVARDGDPGNGGLLLDAHAARAGRLGETDRRAIGIAPAVLRAEAAADHVVEDDMRVQIGDLLGSHPARGHAEALLQGDVLAEDRVLGGVGDEEEVSLLAQADVAAEALREGLPDADALLGEADIRLGRELLAHAAGGIGRGATADLIAFQHHYVGDATLGQRVSDGTAHDPGADDDDRGRTLHRAVPGAASDPAARAPVVVKRSAMRQVSSNRMWAATIAVIWFGWSLLGIRQTTSAPTMSRPRNPRRMAFASSMLKPLTPASILDTAGAALGSRQSRSNEM